MSQAIHKAYENQRAEWRFVFYAPGERMRPHRHELAHFSLIMTGAQREASRGECVETGGMWMAFKPRNFRHENEFGPHGALLLSINLRRAGEDDAEIDDDCWRVKPANGVRNDWAALARALCSATPNEDEVNDLTDEILASLLSSEKAEARPNAPDWLIRAREAAIEEGASVEKIARDAGVHRVHLSRAYRAHFGITLSEEKRRRRLGRAAREIIVSRAPLAEASLAAGYADQAHLTREMRRETGLTPKALLRLF